MNRITVLFFVCLFAIAMSATTYEIVLKNGKIVRGEAVTEDEEKIVLKDSGGISLTFKKTAIDQKKTALANKPVEQPAPQVTAVEPAEKDKNSADPKKAGKPARVYTDRDVNRLRGEYPMDETWKDMDLSAAKSEKKAGRSGEEWQQITGDLLAQWKAAEDSQRRLSAKCNEFKGAAIQTHTAIDEKGQEVNLGEAKERVCQAADDAQQAVDQAQQQYESAVAQAREENVLRGYIVTED